jgi:hypothetical protein
MSENKPTTSSGIELPPEPTTDIVGEDEVKLKKYIEDGLLDVAKLTEVNMKTMMELYLDGRTYSSIARAMEMERELVLYASHKCNWFNFKKVYLTELSAGLEQRTINAKLMARDAIVSIVSYLKSRVGDNMNAFLRTRDEKYAARINLKEMAMYVKLIAMLEGSPDNPDKKAPLVGLNTGQGVTIKKTGENSVEITPKEQTTGEMLKYFSDMRRAEEKAKKTVDAPDIIVDTKKKD